VRTELLEPGDARYYVDGDHFGTDYDHPEREKGGEPRRLTSCICREEQLDSPAFRYWLGRLGEQPRPHRKQWEFAYVIQTLYEHGKLREGSRGLAFAVGSEPLPALFASMGCHIVATDLDVQDRRSTDWAKIGQHAASTERLRRDELCDPEQFDKCVSYRPVDMNAIPDDLTGFDFTWSTCSFEHCGSIALGQQFIWRQMDCLKPGGVAVHTTEFNLTSNTRTRANGNTVLFRRRDIEQIVQRLVDDGHDVAPLDLELGSHPNALDYDRLPYSYNRHLKLEWRSYVATSIGLIIRKAS
jgi:hypothetical protein